MVKNRIKLTISIFWIRFSKRVFLVHWILHIQIRLGTKFQLKLRILIFWTKFDQNVFLVGNRKSEHHYGILHSWISLSTKFQLKLTILSFCTKFTQKAYFQSKTEQAVQGLQVFAFCVVKVNSTVVFEHFEDHKNLIIWNILKEKFVISCPLGSFYLKII